jgi:hypothetical protein
MFTQTAEDFTYILINLGKSSTAITFDREYPQPKYRSGEASKAWKKVYQLQ